MAVTIQLDVDATGATGKIGAVTSSLKGLEMVADDIDLDFDADIGDITDEIDDFSDALSNLEIDNVGFVQDLDKVADKLDTALEKEIDVNVPDGSTGDSDSTGRGPPMSAFNMDFADMVEAADASTDLAREASGVADGGKRANLLERSYGEHTLMGTSGKTPFNAGRLHGLGSNRPESNLGAHDPAFSSSLMQRLGTRTGFGLDPESMDRKREGMDLPTVLENGVPLDKRLSKIVDPQIGDRDLSRSIQEYLDALDELAEGAAKEAREYEFQFLNEERFSKELSGSEQFQAFRQADDRGDLPDFSLENFDSELERKIEGSNAISDSLDNIEKQQRQLYENAGLDPDAIERGDRDLTQRKRDSWANLNDDIRHGFDSNLNQITPETDAEIERATGYQGGLPDFDLGGGRRRGFGIDKIDNIDLKSLNNGFGKFEKKLKKLTPSMGQYMQLLAAILPMMVTLAAQALGVAAALGAVGAAGAGIIGLGLLGHGESMAESFAEAKQQIKDLKREMFATFQPAAQQFAPIQARAFDAIPEALDPVAEEMEGLTVYEDTLFNLGSALAGGMERAVEIIVENENAISDLSTTFGGLIGSGLLDFFSWLIKEASENQQLLIDLGQTFLTLASVAYRLSKFISKLVVKFQPLFEVLAAVAGFLNNDFIVGFLVLMGVWGSFILLTSKVVTSLYAVAMAMQTVGGSGVIATIVGGIARITGMLYGLIAAAWEANVALGVLASLATLGLATGAAMISHQAIKGMAPDTPDPGGVGGPGGATAAGGGNGMVYNDNRSYEINNGGGDDYASRKAMEDTVKRVNGTNDAQSLPDVETSSDSSDGNNN